MRSVKHQHAAIIFFLTLPCQQLSDLQAERSFKKQILMMLPTITTGSEIGTNLAQSGSRAGSLASQHPRWALPSCPSSVHPGEGMQLYRHSRTPSPETSWLLLLHWFIWVQGAWNVLFSDEFHVCVGKQREQYATVPIASADWYCGWHKHICMWLP